MTSPAIRRLCAAFALSAGAGALSACSEDAAAPAPGNTGGAASTTTTSHAGAGGAGGDEGSSCADAVELRQEQNSFGGVYYERWGVLDPAGDRDYFRFEAEAGQWFGIVTQANPDADPDRIDTVLALFDESGSVPLALANGAVPSAGRDSEIIHRFEKAGSYCLEVLEHSDWVGDAPEGGPDFSYRVVAYPVDFELYDDWNLDEEGNDGPAAAQPLSVVEIEGASSTRIAGTLDPGTDVDTFRFVTPPTAHAALLYFAPSGPLGHGSTNGPGLVRVRRDDGIIAQVDYQLGSTALMATLEPEQSYLVEATRPDGLPVGSNDFYLFKLRTFGGLTSEHEPNDEPAQADEGHTVPAPNVKQFWPRGLLPPGDVDWWQLPFDVAGAQLHIWCASQQLGSALRDATFDFYAPGYPPASSGPTWTKVESATAAVEWSGEVYMGLGYLRVTATQYEPGIESTLYYCSATALYPD